MKHYLGIDVGGTRIKFGLVNEIGEIIKKDQLDTPKSHQDLVSAITGIYQESIKDETVFGVGLSMPGIIKQSKMMTSGALRFIDVDCFLEDIKQEIKLPLVLVNDANAVALAERWNGHAIDYNDFACVTLGTAVGGSYFINGSLYEGVSGLAGEFGMSFNLGIEQPTLYDTVAAHCGVVAGACRKYSEKSEFKTRDFEVIIQRANEGEGLAQEIVDAFCNDNALMFYNLAVTLGVEAILVGGGVSHNEMITQRIEARYRELCETMKVFPISLLPLLKVCYHHGDSGVIGAVYHLKQSMA